MLEHHVPVVSCVCAVELAVGRPVEGSTVVDRVIRRGEGVGCIVIDDTTVAVVRIVQIGDTVVVVVPVNAVLETVTVNVGIDIVRTVVSVQTAVDLMQVIVVVKVAIPVNVENVNDTVVVVVNVVPVADAIAIPVVELGERSTSGLTSWVGVNGIGVGLSWTVPGGNVGCGVERERVVFVFDVVVVQVIGKVCTTNGEVAEVVRRGGSAHVGIEPVVNAVVVLVKGSAYIVVKVAVVVDFTIGCAVLVAVASWNFEVHA